MKQSLRINPYTDHNDALSILPPRAAENLLKSCATKMIAVVRDKAPGGGTQVLSAIGMFR